jgi:polyisoprenoid-binding protein YceI
MLPCLALGLAATLLARPSPAVAAEFVSDPARSKLAFSFTQAGAVNSGEFRHFNVRFREPDDTGSDGELIVDIDTASLSTDDSDRDEILRGPDLFSTERFPAARFVADRIEAAGEGHYRAVGTLTIRDLSHTMELPLTVRPVTGSAPQAVSLVGEVAINRLDYGVGQGEWTSTEWVADKVVISWSVGLVPGTNASAAQSGAAP